MLLIKNEKEYPLFLGDLLIEHPEWQEGADLPTGWELVQQTTLPKMIYGEETLASDIVEKTENGWVQVLTVRATTDAEKQEIAARKEYLDSLVKVEVEEAELVVEDTPEEVIDTPAE